MLENYGKRRWLKVYCLLVSEGWKKNLFYDSEIEQYGEIYKATPANSNEKDREVYFLEEYADGLLLLHTAASNERYQRDLGERIRRRRVVARMWMRPDLFRSFYGGILQEGQGYVYLFSGRRSPRRDEYAIQST